MKDVLSALLAAIKGACGIQPTYGQTEEVDIPAITYTFYRTQDNGAVARYRLQLRFFAPTLSKCASIEETATQSLVTLGDSLKFDCSISSNGGGALLDSETNTPQLITYYDITARS